MALKSQASDSCSVVEDTKPSLSRVARAFVIHVRRTTNRVRHTTNEVRRTINGVAHGLGKFALHIG